MPNKRKICTENLNSNQSIYIASLNSYYQPESVLNSAYRKVLDFKENAEKILEKEKSETLNLNDFSKAILDSRSFEISLQHNCIKLKCYITLEKDKDSKKKRNEQQQLQQQQLQQQQQQQQSPPGSPLACMNPTSSYGHIRHESTSSYNDLGFFDSTTSPKATGSNAGVVGGSNIVNSGGAKKVNVEVIMKSNPFRVEENEKTTRMELIKNTDNSSNGGGNMLRFTYYVRPECEKFRETNSELFEKGRLVVFTNDFFTVYQDTSTGEMNISLNEIVQSQEEQKRTEALGEKLFLLLKDRPRHRALLTNECKLNHSMSLQNLNGIYASEQFMSMGGNSGMMTLLTNQEDETYYTRELIQIYGQPIVPSFHKHFNYQLSNTHYGYRTLRRLLNCDILKKYVKITKEEIKSLDRVVEFVQLTPEKCLSAFQLNITSFYDPNRFENGIVKNWLDVWYVDRLKEKYSNSNEFQQQQQQQQQQLSSPNSSPSSQHNSLSPQSPGGCSLTSSLSSPSSLSLSISPLSTPTTTSSSGSHGCNSWSVSLNDPILKHHSTSQSQLFSSFGSASRSNCFLHTSNCCNDTQQPDESFSVFSECDQANHLWFCLRDYSCTKMSEFIIKLKDYIQIKNNRSELILVHTAHPLFEYKDVLSETRRILALFLSKSTINKTLDEIISRQFPLVAKEHIENLLSKFLIIDAEKKVVGFTALFEILMILKRELSKEKNDEMKYSHFLCTLERANQEKLKMAIVQLKCVPCLNKFTTNFNMLQQSQSTASSSSLSSSSTSQLNSSANSKSNTVSHANMSRLLKQMSLIVSTELQQIAIDLFEKLDEDKPIKFIKLKDEFKYTSTMLQQQHLQQSPNMQSMNINQSTSQFKSPSSQAQMSHGHIQSSSNQTKQYMVKSNEMTSTTVNGTSTSTTPTNNTSNHLIKQQQQQINNIQMSNLTASFKKVDLSKSNTTTTNTGTGLKPTQVNTNTSKLPQIFNPKKDLEQFISQDQKSQQDLASFRTSLERVNTGNFYYTDTY